MQLRKTMLAVAISSVLYVPLAQAAIDINSDTDQALSIVNEVQVTDGSAGIFRSGTPAATVNEAEYVSAFPNGALLIKFQVGFSLQGGQDYAVRFDLSGGGAKFKDPEFTNITNNAPIRDSAGAQIDIATNPGVGTPDFTQTPQGDASDTGLVVTLNPVSGATILSDTEFYIAPQIQLSSQEDVTITYALYDSQVAALNKASEKQFFTPITVKIMAFNSGLVQLAENPIPTPAKINVATNSTSFIDEATDAEVTSTPVCTFTLKETTGLYFPDTKQRANDDTGAAAAPTPEIDVVTDGTVLTVTGDFNFAQTGSGFDVNNVFLALGDASGACGGSTVPADVLDATTATFNLDNFTPSSYAAGSVSSSVGLPVSVCLQPNGTAEINPIEFSAAYTPVALTDSDVGSTTGAGATDVSFAVSPIDINCAELTRSGTTQVVPMFLGVKGDGGAAYDSYIRITNPSDIDGKINITAVNDAGTEGGSTWTIMLGKKQSTGLITPQQIIDNTGVSVLSDPATVGSGKLNKMRVIINAEFGQQGSDSEVKVKVLTLSKDGNSFVSYD